eukprot:CAMPEP_0119104708 /NCGR_PEP_ID=MMETSP1180-20130426/2856_1 /TAXON_ID=3052 ORGANISM="Chlamydomonas cf sp, Strain CCMP681" /NCGR_SAMPLE_ID=MMETSP1180 /ASSEMBLY_ACC=CAM_ASM_000741 /LENGTH=337 /DNA_ID=CAMNT_0007089539 /DNA_START=75 /DNA_END=1088 /DNA_ORIENTATION=-
MAPVLDGPSTAHPLLAGFYCAANIVVAACIVFANKWVFSYYNFKFVFALALIHTLFTVAGMNVLACMGFFIPKRIPVAKLIPLALGFVGYVVLCNVSLKINSVGFYQIMKIAIAPTVVVMEFLMFNKLPSRLMLCAVLVVCAGITVATVSDAVAIQNTMGLVVGIAATFVTALYQIWAGSKQRELQANSSQLLQAYTPHAAWLLTILVPIFEPIGWKTAGPDTLLGFAYTPEAVGAIVISAVLGILVSLTTFLVIGTTSSLTYNIVGHLKTVIILTGGVVFFGEAMPAKRLGGISIAMMGIGWYTLLLSQPTQPTQPIVKSLSPLTPLSHKPAQTAA